MIPWEGLEEWQRNVKWKTMDMIEQDLVISRALVCLYDDSRIKNSLVFRGGTALNKLFLTPAQRYSEDIDFVQREPKPIGPTIDAIRQILKDWLGEPKRKITERGIKLIYRYQTIEEERAKLKVEINTTEHFQVLPLKFESFSVESEWFRGTSEIVTYQLEELMATKLRALYQRRKGRDLFDLWSVVTRQQVNVMEPIFQESNSWKTWSKREKTKIFN